MVFLLLVASLVFIWIVSLCKIFYFSKPISNPSAFSLAGSSKKGRNVLLVIAHPDDESMFFSPTLLFLASQKHNLHVLCFSTGNADGMGEIRKNELFRACVMLQVPHQNINILDHPDLQDGFGRSWDHKLLAAMIGNQIKTWEINMIITFDRYGVSGHCNHCDVHYGTRKFLSESSTESIEALQLVSTSIFRKYSGPLDIWLSLLYTIFYPRRQSFCLVNAHPRRCFLAMAEHESQWVWFRRLFVLFSSYSYINVLKKMTP